MKTINRIHEILEFECRPCKRTVAVRKETDIAKFCGANCEFGKELLQLGNVLHEEVKEKRRLKREQR